jgi:undecaprenyl-diphosphatase
VLVATVLVALFTWHAYHPTATEQAVADFFHSLPDDARTFLRLGYVVVSLWAIGIVVVAALLVRRRDLARDLLVAGVGAWITGRLLAFVVHQTDFFGAFKVTFDLSDAPRFPVVRIAVAVAVIVVAGPYLTRPVRWLGGALILLLAGTVMYLGRGQISDVLAAFALGWGIAALVHYAFGTPLGRPTTKQVRATLEQLGVEVDDVTEDPVQPVGRALLTAEGPGGPLDVVALGRDEADAQFLARAWRFVAYRDAPPMLLPTRRRQVEYEALVLLLAGQEGAAVPRVVGAGERDGVAVLALDRPPGVPLVAYAAEHTVDDTLLERIWVQAARLHGARIAHGRLDADHVVVADAGTQVSLVGWDRAVAGATDRQIAGDLAQLLAASASLVGDERAIAVARKTVEPDLLATALPWLQTAAVAWVTRDAFDRDDGSDDSLEQLRTDTAAALGVDPPELTARTRVNPRRVLMAVAVLFAVGVLLSRVGDPVKFWETIRDASWGFVGLAFVFGILTDVSFAFAFLGTLPELTPIWPTIELQMSLSFANLAIPVAADAAMQVRFLQKNGYELSEAVATGGVLSSVSEIVVQGALFGIALLLAPDSIEFGHIDTTQIVVVVLGVIFLIGVAAGIVLGVRRVRKIVLPPALRALRALWGAVKQPSRIGLMVGGNVAAQSFYVCSLLSCLAAFGHPVDFWTLLALNIGMSLIASLVPFPGGGTAVSAIGLTGMLVTLGVPSAAATAAVLSHQLAVTYLPAVPGWFASNDLVKRRML